MLADKSDQNNGQFPVEKSDHAFGKYVVSWSLDYGSVVSEEVLPAALNDTFCKSLSIVDGQSYTFNIRPVDIEKSTYIESQKVLIDGSQPDTSFVCLNNKTTKDSCVVSITYQSPLHLQFDARDSHSGISKCVWTLGITKATNDTLLEATIANGT